MNIEKLLLAILLSLIVLLGVITISGLIVVCVTSFLSIEQYSGLIGIISVLILFVFLVLDIVNACSIELKHENQKLRQTEKEDIDFLSSKTTRHNESEGNTYRRPPFIRPYD